jgi:hypothetical protein
MMGEMSIKWRDREKLEMVKKGSKEEKNEV